MAIKSFDKANSSNKQIDILKDFSGGLNTELADSATKDNQFRKLTNFDIDKAGSLMKRPGLYKVPYIEKLLNRRLDDVINNQEVLINGQPVDKTQFQIQECIPFFDGIHWVYNYITTFGVFVILLDKNMNIPNGLGDLDLTTNDYKKIAQFYPININTTDTTKTVFKISKYNDQYLMYKSIYQTRFTDPKDHNRRQVCVYSWNPIYNDNYLDSTLPNNVLYPQWLEASWDKDRLISDTSFGDVKNLKEYSNKLVDFINFNDSISLNVSSIRQKYVIDPNGFLNQYDIKIFYKPNTPYAQLVIKRKLKTDPNYETIIVDLKHQNGVPIVDEQIANIYLYDAEHIQINLFESVKYTDRFIKDNFWKVFIDWKDENVLNNRIDLYNKLLISTIKWFWIKVSAPDLEHMYLYSNTIEQKVYKSTYDSQGGFISVYDFNVLNGKQTKVFIDNGLKSKKDDPIDPQFNILMSYYKSDFQQSRANNIYFSNYGTPFKINFKYKSKGTPTTLPTRYDNLFAAHNFGRGSDRGVHQWYIKKTTNFIPNPREKLYDFYESYKLELNASKGYYDERNMHMSVFFNSVYGLNFFKYLKFINNKINDDIYEIGVEDVVSCTFPFLGLYIINNFTVRIPSHGPGGGASYDHITQISGPKGTLITTYPEPDPRYQMVRETRSLYLDLDPTHYGWSDGNSGSKPLQGVHMYSYKDFYTLAGCSSGNLILSRHLINEQEDFFGFGNSLYNIETSDNRTLTIAAATMNKNTFNFINPTSIDFINDLVANNISILGFNSVDKHLTPLQLFGDKLLEVFRKALDIYNDNKLINPKLFLVYLNSKNQKQYLDLNLSEIDLIQHIVNESVNNPNNTNLFTLEYLFLNNPANPNENNPITFKLTYHYKGKVINILDFNNIKNLIDDISDWNNFIRTLLFTFSAKWLLSTNSDNQVINFKQQLYTKPTLNDIVNIWYNLILFSKFETDANTDSRKPDIYNSQDHPYISNELMQYPDSKLQLQYSSIQLFGLQPVNDLFTNVGKQRFQLFYKLNDGFTTDKFKVALTTMSVADYNAMINSNDYSTDLGQGDKTGKKTPVWTEWDVIFNIKTNKPNVAIFEMNIPSTTSPYLILLQIAEKNPDVSKGQIKLSTLVETRIELQPSNSANTKLNISSIFDEFVLTNKLVSYSSNLISYGNSNKIFFNEISNATYFPLSRVIELKTPEAVRSANVFQNKLIISTENSKYYIGGSSFDNSSDPFYLREIASDSGVLAPKTDIPMGNYLYFLDTTGIKILKNLFGTADKEFSFESIDTIIKSIVAKDKDACAATLDNKYFICFPSYKYMLVYHFDYKAWVSYESAYFNFSTMFVNDGELYGVDRDNFKVFKFDKNVYVDNWNEVEVWYELHKGKITKFGGYTQALTIDNQPVQVQQGAAISCELETKQLDQDYTPHRKKYDYVLISSYLDHNDLKQQNFGASLKPIIKVDDNIINYKFSIVNDSNVYNYVEDSQGVSVREDSALNATAALNKNRLGLNSLNNYYYVPIRRKGNALSIGFKFNAPTNINIDSLYIRYGLTKAKKSRGGIS